MFTGIIQSLGHVHDIDNESNNFIIKTKLDLNDCFIGSSICCDGVCLTTTNITNHKNNFFFTLNIGEETIKRSNLNAWHIEKEINIEKSLKVGDEISGHFVYGHIDTVVKTKKIIKLKNSWEYEFSFQNNLEDNAYNRFIVEKGSVAINGVSLTIANVYKNYFNVSIIPHTFLNTNLSKLKENDLVNIEFDPLARYMSKYYEK